MRSPRSAEHNNKETAAMIRRLALALAVSTIALAGVAPSASPAMATEATTATTPRKVRPLPARRATTPSLARLAMRYDAMLRTRGYPYSFIGVGYQW